MFSSDTTKTQWQTEEKQDVSKSEKEIDSVIKLAQF